MARVIRKRKFSAPAIDFLDLSYLIPMLCAASLKESAEHPFKYGSFFALGKTVTQSAGKFSRWRAYENFVRMLMVTQPEAEDVRSEDVAKWVTSLYENRQYPYIVLGPPIGSLAYLSAVLDAPFLPLNYALAVRHPAMNPDDGKANAAAAEKLAAFFLKNDNNIQIVNEYDPVHQRFRLKHGTLLRCRYLKVPQAYDQFIKTHLRPNGTVMIVESRIGWRQYKLGDNLFHQVGRPGGIPCEEYLFGSNRLNVFRAKFLQDEASYKLPRRDELQPEATYGVTPGIRLSIIDSANAHGRNICQLFTEEMYLLNELVSHLFVRCARREGLRPKYCYIHSGGFIAPYLCLRSTLVPVWVPTPCFPAFEFVRSFLKRYPFELEQILMSFEPSIEEAPDFLQIDRWRESVGDRPRPVFAGMSPRLYPREITSYFKFWPALKNWSNRHVQPLNIRVSTDIVIEEAENCGIKFQVIENTNSAG